MKKLLSTLIAAAAIIVPAAQSFAYTVQPGDTLSTIAIKNRLYNICWGMRKIKTKKYTQAP
ncbi:LysM peptidoglycan-binding domain-containing protein [Scopulibacillus daqui]|uniref:LysM peptidoglycan-binding domain-containing protein n=1 Tax=Scopulibacillus daqui TaxID=1469162 RepID=UPI00363BD05D